MEWRGRGKWRSWFGSSNGAGAGAVAVAVELGFSSVRRWEDRDTSIGERSVGRHLGRGFFLKCGELFRLLLAIRSIFDQKVFVVHRTLTFCLAKGRTSSNVGRVGPFFPCLCQNLSLISAFGVSSTENEVPAPAECTLDTVGHSCIRLSSPPFSGFRTKKASNFSISRFCRRRKSSITLLHPTK